MKLEVQNISFSYENSLLMKDISFSVSEGEFISLLGPSGCGKSTLLKLMAGVLPPETGGVSVDGQPVTGVSGHFAYMPQDDLLFPWKTILENVCLYGRIHGGMEETRRRAKELFPVFGLSGYEDRYPSALSGGMRQRAAFLRTALCRADVLLLDEPFGALDVITRGEMQDWLLEMRQALNKTVVLVTHDMDEAIYLSDRVLVLNGTPAEIAVQLPIEEKRRDRSWLYAQGALRQAIYEKIRRPER